MPLLFLNSANGTQNNDSETDITWDVSSANLVSPNRLFNISLKQLEFPISFYNVNSSNSTVNLHVNGAGTDYTLAVENYTAETLRDALTALLPAITCAYDEPTNKFTFTKASGDFTLSGNCFRLLGLPSTSGEASTGSSLTPTNMVNMVSKSYLKCRLDETNNGTAELRLGKVQLDSGIYELVYYDEPNPELLRLAGFPTITSLRLRLVDPDQNTFDLNGVPWSVTLEVEALG